jgi:hypothetical protein
MSHNSTNTGLHDFVWLRVLGHYALSGVRVAPRGISGFGLFLDALVGDNSIFSLEATL